MGQQLGCRPSVLTWSTQLTIRYQHIEILVLLPEHWGTMALLPRSTLRLWDSVLHTGTLWHPYLHIETLGCLPAHGDHVALLPAHWDPGTPTCMLGPRNSLTLTLRPWDSYLPTGTPWHSYQHSETLGLLPAHWDRVALLPAYWDPGTPTCTPEPYICGTFTCILRSLDSYLHTGTLWHSDLHLRPWVSYLHSKN